MRNINVLAKRHINEVLRSGKLRGSNKTCDSYPCHFEGQDCTWCYCPLYPCLNPNGNYVTSGTGRRIWDCSRCEAVHEARTAREILEILSKAGRSIEEIGPGNLASARKLVAKARK